MQMYQNQKACLLFIENDVVVKKVFTVFTHNLLPHIEDIKRVKTYVD
jgi:hypothetical protein